jgi:hypothetical protein
MFVSALTPPHIHIILERERIVRTPILFIYSLLFQENISYINKLIIIIRILIGLSALGFAVFIPTYILYLLATNKKL